MPTSDRVLDGPTNEVWLYPWLQHLAALGVTYLPETAATEIIYAGGRVSGVQVTSSRGTETLVGDYYVCALPAERAATVFSPALMAADPRLACVRQLADTCLEWMNGVQFYLRRPVRMVRGHTIHIDTEWALTSISQIDVWRPGTMDRYGPQTIQCILSVDVSDWDAPAPNGRSATQHTREEVGREVWRQLKRSMNAPGEEDVLRDDDLIGWFLDSSIDRDPDHPGLLTNTEPLLVNLVDSWRLRPDAATAVPNLFLASDYVRTNTDLATMEGANEAARHAVNAILDRDGHAAPRCRIWPLHEPLALAPLREYDAIRFGLGLPWDGGLVTVAAAAVEAADPLLGPVAASARRAWRPTRSRCRAPSTSWIGPRLRSRRPTTWPNGWARSWAALRDELEGSVPVLDRETQAARLGRDLATPAAAASRYPRRPGRVRRAPRLVPRPDAHGHGRRDPDGRTPRAPLRPPAHVRGAAEQGPSSRALPGRLPGLRRPDERSHPLSRGHRDAAQRVPGARRHRGRQRGAARRADLAPAARHTRSRSTSATR